MTPALLSLLLMAAPVASAADPAPTAAWTARSIDAWVPPLAPGTDTTLKVEVGPATMPKPRSPTPRAVTKEQCRDAIARSWDVRPALGRVGRSVRVGDALIPMSENLFDWTKSCYDDFERATNQENRAPSNRFSDFQYFHSAIEEIAHRPKHILLGGLGVATGAALGAGSVRLAQEGEGVSILGFLFAATIIPMGVQGVMPPSESSTLTMFDAYGKRALKDYREILTDSQSCSTFNADSQSIDEIGRRAYACNRLTWMDERQRPYLAPFKLGRAVATAEAAQSILNARYKALQDFGTWRTNYVKTQAACDVMPSSFLGFFGYETEQVTQTRSACDKALTMLADYPMLTQEHARIEGVKAKLEAGVVETKRTFTIKMQTSSANTCLDMTVAALTRDEACERTLKGIQEDQGRGWFVGNLADVAAITTSKASVAAAAAQERARKDREYEERRRQERAEEQWRQNNCYEIWTCSRTGQQIRRGYGSDGPSSDDYKCNCDRRNCGYSEPGYWTNETFCQ